MSETLTNGVIVPDKGSRDWYADLRSNWLKLDSLMAGGNITINPAQTDGILVATITVGGKEYKLYQQDGDVSVKIDPSTENAEYPLVASTSAEAITGSVVMAPAVTVNPSSGAVTATSFKGKLEGNASTATTATKAVQDGAGAVITNTYATKSELGSKAEDANVVHKSGAESIDGLKTFNYWQIINLGLNVKWITGNKEQKSLHLFGSMNDRYEGYGSVLELHGDDEKYGMFTLIAKDKTNTNVKRFVGLPDGSLTWDNNEILTRVNGVTLDTAQTITGAKTFTPWTTFSNGINVKWITGNKEQKSLHLSATMNDSYQGYGAILQLLSEDLNGGFRLIANNKPGTNLKILEGDSNGTLTWDSFKILLETNRIALCKNLTGANITPGGVIDCGNGNGKLKQWYLNADGTFLLANTLPTGIWKSTSFVTLAPNEGSIFIKLS